jgi:hypothetical protein
MQGDSSKIGAKVTSSNFVIETGESLNFFDTFSPHNLELLEIDTFEDYTKIFLHKGQNKYNTIQYNTIQYNTIQYNTIQYNTIQYNTIQYNTINIVLFWNRR